MNEYRLSICRDGGFQTRADDGNLYIEGYFSVFNREYKMWDGAVETVDPHAFDETLNDDIRALVNHDTTLVLGRTTVGTLTLKVDQRGLWGRITINQQDQDAMNLYNRVARGDVSQCSFGFLIEEEDVFDRPDGTVEFRILKVKLYEVSVVTFPAYKDTAVVARKRDFEDHSKRKREAWAASMMKKLKGD